jgi:hypothetical protein
MRILQLRWEDEYVWRDLETIPDNVVVDIEQKKREYIERMKEKNYDKYPIPVFRVVRGEVE